MRKKQTVKKRLSALGLDNHLPTEGQGRDEMMQIYAWNFEDAWNAQEEWEMRYGQNIRGRGPFFRWIGTQELKELYDIYKAGNSQAVMEALFVCSLNSLPLPRWCESAFLSAYRNVRQYKAKSWDDVFGSPHKKGTHLGTKKQEREFSWKVYKRIQQIKKDDPSIAIDGFLFESIGKEFGIGSKTLTENYYYKMKKLHRKEVNTVS